MTHSPEQFLAELRRRGATRLSRVSFRKNRSTVWSLTQGGRVLNLHTAYGSASPDLLDAFADLLRERGWGMAAKRRRAASAIRSWPPLAEALREVRAERGDRRESACCATSGQSRYLRTLYRYFNQTRFEGRLPDDLPLRLSNRMRSALGYMVPGESGGAERRVREIALNLDLMLEGNGAERIDTLLHEMAHAADYLLSGHRGHGASWREWALRVGCRPGRLYEKPIRTRRRRAAAVTRVPPLPPALAAFAD
ncbi:MAG: SprT family zinc-dependent metalloprotease [Longimicrobiales bacterium]